MFRVVPTSLAPHGDTKLRDAANPYGNHHNRAREGRNEERHGDGHSSAHREEVDPHVTGVLSNEINERYAKNDGHDDTDPGGGNSRVTEVFPRGLRIATVRRCGRLQFLFVRLSAVVIAHVNLNPSQSGPV
jgi:hypothetical protein